jgi:FixJ family two-component response regulator
MKKLKRAHRGRPGTDGGKNWHFKVSGLPAGPGLKASYTAAGVGYTVFFMVKSRAWIAIVDDDASVLKALSRSLRFRGLQTKAFESAQAFIGSLPAGLPDCLIVDLQMPEMTGLELHQYLTRNGIQIPTIIITAHSDAGVRARSDSTGIIAVLSKPFEKASLLAAIDVAKSKNIRNHKSP